MCLVFVVLFYYYFLPPNMEAISYVTVSLICQPALLDLISQTPTYGLNSTMRHWRKMFP